MDVKNGIQIGNEILSFSEELAEKINVSSINANHLTIYQALLATSFYEAKDYLRSVLILCKNKLVTQGNVLVRVLYEIYITLNFLRNKQEYVERFAEYQNYKLMIKVFDLEKCGEKIFPDTQEGKSRREEVINKGEEARAKHSFNRGKWYPKEYPNFETICKAVGSEKDYQLVYRHLSEIVHFDPYYISSNYNFVITKDYAEFEKRAQCEASILSACDLSLTIFAFINDEHNLALGSRIDELKKRANS